MPISLVILLNAQHFMFCSNENEASKNTGFRYVVLNLFAFTYNEISMGISFTREILYISNRLYDRIPAKSYVETLYKNR